MSQKFEEAKQLAHREICDLASGKRRWEMSIPPRSTDSDVVLQNALDVASNEIQRLERALERCREQRDYYNKTAFRGLLSYYVKKDDAEIEAILRGEA